MTTKKAALLAAVGTTLSVASGLLSNFLSWVQFAVHLENGSALDALRAYAPTWLMMFVGGAPLPLFLFLLYRSQPLLSIPSSLKKAAWVAAIVSGLVAIAGVFRWGMVVARNETGTLTAPLGLRRAATYAFVVAALGAAMSPIPVYSTFALSGSSQLKALLQAGPRALAWWDLILPPAISALNQASLAAFFLVFCLKVRVPQSNQRLSNGE